MNLAEERYPHTIGSSPNKSGVWQVSPDASTRLVDDEIILTWLAQAGFPVEDIHEERQSMHPAGAAVHLAAFEGSVRHLRWLHAHGANLSQVASETGETPMHLAMSGGSLNAVAFLYKHGCAKDLSTAANNGRVPVLYAEEKGHIRLIRWHAEVQNGVNWTKDSPGMLVPEASLCPPPQAGSRHSQANRASLRSQLCLGL